MPPGPSPGAQSSLSSVDLPLNSKGMHFQTLQKSIRCYGEIPLGCQKRTCEEGSLFSSSGWLLVLKGSFLQIRSLLLGHLVAIFFELLRIEGACPRCNVVQDRLYRVAGVEPLWNLTEIEGLRGRILRTSKWSLEDNEENPF